MIRMHKRLTRAMQLHFIYHGKIQYGDLDGVLRAMLQELTNTLSQARWNFSNSLIIDPVLLRMPTRSRGRPRTRWDDVLTDFTRDVLYSANHWIDRIVPYIHDIQIEDASVNFCSPTVD